MMMMMIMICQGHDRLLLIAGADINHRGRSSRRRPPSGDGSSGGGSSTADLTMTHVQLPHLYITSNWPLQHVALSESGADIAVAGRRGLALYNRPTEKWVHTLSKLHQHLTADPEFPVHTKFHKPREHCLTWCALTCGVAACKSSGMKVVQVLFPSSSDAGRSSSAAGDETQQVCGPGDWITSLRGALLKTPHTAKPFLCRLPTVPCCLNPVCLKTS